MAKENFSLQDLLSTLKNVVFVSKCPVQVREQNGVVERKHKHIIESSLTMIFHAGLPKGLWVEAFLTTTFLINRLPSKVIEMQTPFYKLFEQHPDYTILKVFGCRCFSYLRGRTSNKFQPKSYPCVFVGYSSLHKGFRCYRPLSRKVYISRHVVFDETDIPYTNLFHCLKPLRLKPPLQLTRSL